MKGGLIVIVVYAALDCITRPDEILAEVVGDQDLLATIIECVQAAVGILLRLAKEDQVELIAV